MDPSHSRPDSDPEVEVSVVLPVLNEVENLPRVVPLLITAVERTGKTFEIIVVDDGSTDGTLEVLSELARDPRVIVHRRRWQTGLASAVVSGFERASGTVLGVLDADLSHDIELVPELIRALDASGVSMAIGSRYVEGARVDANWSVSRRLMSRVATLMARVLTPVRDPLSGFFFVERSLLDGVKVRPMGFKICLELLVRTRCRDYVELPYHFADRTQGSSKLDWSVVLGYLIQIADLAFSRLRGSR